MVPTLEGAPMPTRRRSPAGPARRRPVGPCPLRRGPVRRVGSAGVALVVLLGASACSSESGGHTGTTTTRPGARSSTSTGTNPGNAGVAVPKVRAGVFAAGTCPEPAAVEAPATVACGMLTVPERHDQPGGAVVRLPIAVITHPGTSPADPVVYLDGGPGGDGVGASATLGSLPLAADRTVVVIGQRGSTFADPTLDCPEVQAVVDAHLGQALDGATVKADRAALAACYTRVTASKVDLRAYDSDSSADDVEAVRLALGYDQWNLYGVSYGTRLALEVMRRHPAGVRSVILDSSYPPEVESWASLVPSADRSFQAIVAACGEDPSCAPLAPKLADRVQALYERLEQHPVDAQVPDPATGQPVTVRWDGTRFAQAVFRAQYSGAIIALMPTLLDSLEHGDFGIATTYYVGVVASDLSLAEGLHWAVECRERAPFSNTADVARSGGGSPGWMTPAVGAEADLAGCTAWKAPALKARPKPVTSDIPTLVLAGRFDPITPPAWGHDVAKTLSRSRFVELPDGGHGMSLSPTGCGATVVASFLRDPVSAPDPACVATSTVHWAIP